MRIPLHKIYRAFPELDKFDDERCEAYVRAARQMHRWSQLLSWVVSALLVCPGSCLSGMLMTMLLRRAVGDLELGNLEPVIFISVAALALAVPLIGALLVGDVWLRWAIRRQLNTAVCPDCRYSLLGLRVVSDSVVCPECGGAIRLADLGLTPADVLAEASGERFSAQGG